jgi:hypothetical protein
MSGWITHTAAFLFGIVVGALSFAAIARRRTAGRDPRKALQQLYRESPRFFDELRAEIKRPEFRHVREFAILESSRETFVSEDLRFVLYEEDIAGLKAIAAALEDIGFADDVSRGKTPIFRLRENFIDALKAL